MSESKPEPVPAARHVPQTTSARHTLNIFTSRLVTLPLTIGTSILVARTLGPTDRGIYGFLVLLGSFVLPLLMFGFGAAITYFISNKRYPIAAVFTTCLAVGLMQGALGSLLLGCLFYFDVLGETARETPASLMVPMLLILPLQGAIQTTTRAVVGDSWFTAGNRIQLATALLTATTLLLFVVGCRLGLQGAVAAVVTTNVTVLAGILYTSFRRYRPVIEFNAGFVREGWRYGMKSYLADVAGYSNLRLDQWVLGAITVPEVLGTYTIAVTIAQMLWMLPDSLANVLFNKIAAARDQAERIELVERANRVVFWVVALAGLMVAVTGPLLVPLLYGSKYAAAALPLALLMPGTVAFAVCKVLTKYFSGTGSPQHSGTAVTVGGLVGCALYFVFIPLFGAAGAALAASACYIASAGTSLLIYRKLVAPHRPRLFRFNRHDLVWLEDQVRMAMGKKRSASQQALSK